MAGLTPHLAKPRGGPAIRSAPRDARAVKFKLTHYPSAGGGSVLETLAAEPPVLSSSVDSANPAHLVNVSTGNTQSSMVVADSLRIGRL